MNRLIPSPQQPPTETSVPRPICCRIEPFLHISAFFGGPWAELYRYAYALAVEQTTAEAIRLRRLGHVPPSVN